MSMNCTGCKWDDKKEGGRYCNFYKEYKLAMDQSDNPDYEPFKHGWCPEDTGRIEISVHELRTIIKEQEDKIKALEGVISQIIWERDVALDQLENDYGTSLGAKVDVPKLMKHLNLKEVQYGEKHEKE